MSYEDWLRNFDNCQICNLTPDTINDISEKDWQNSRLLSNIFSMWQCQMFHGKWIKGVSSGGTGQYNQGKLSFFNILFILKLINLKLNIGRILSIHLL